MWNYRIIRITSDDPFDDCEYGIYEVYYNDSGEIFAHDTKPIIVGDSVEDVKAALKDIEEDINKYSVIDGDSLQFADING